MVHARNDDDDNYQIEVSTKERKHQISYQNGLADTGDSLTRVCSGKIKREVWKTKNIHKWN